MDLPSTTPLQTKNEFSVDSRYHKMHMLSFVPSKVLFELRNEEAKEQLYQEMLWLAKVMDKFKIEKNYSKWNNDSIKWYSCEEIKSLSLFDVADLNDLYYEWSKNKWSFSIIEKQIETTVFAKKLFRIMKHFFIGFLIGRCFIFFINLF